MHLFSRRDIMCPRLPSNLLPSWGRGPWTLDPPAPKTSVLGLQVQIAVAGFYVCYRRKPGLGKKRWELLATELLFQSFFVCFLPYRFHMLVQYSRTELPSQSWWGREKQQQKERPILLWWLLYKKEKQIVCSYLPNYIMSSEFMIPYLICIFTKWFWDCVGTAFTGNNSVSFVDLGS